MAMIQDSVSIAANATNNNVLSGSVFEFAAANELIEVAIIGSATGLVVTVLSGQDVLLEESPISLQNRFPIYPDDFIAPDIIAAGERLVIRVRNTTGGALTLFFAVRSRAV